MADTHLPDTGCNDLLFRHGIFRINTDISAGSQSMEDVAKTAKHAGMDFIVVSDQFLVKAQYGVPPLKHICSLTLSRKSVLSYGLEKYLARIKKSLKILKPNSKAHLFSSSFMVFMVSKRLQIYEFYIFLSIIAVISYFRYRKTSKQKPC